MKFLNTLRAIFRTNQKLICEMSEDKGPYDWHDYYDDVIGEPCHFVLLTCKYCDKKFYM